MKKDNVYSIKGSIWRRLTRREFLKVSMAAAGTLALPALAGCQPHVDVTIPATLTATPATVPLTQPKEIRSENGVLKTCLLVNLQHTSIPPGNEDQTRVRMYGSPKADLNQPTQPR